jgi:hypothetical protein
MKVEFEYLGFIMNEDLLIKEVGKSKFILLPEQYGMFYILPDTNIKIELRCKLCKAKNERNDEIDLLVGNEAMMGLVPCRECNSNSLIVFNKPTILRFLSETGMDPHLIRERWGSVASILTH